MSIRGFAGFRVEIDFASEQEAEGLNDATLDQMSDDYDELGVSEQVEALVNTLIGSRESLCRLVVRVED